MSVERIRLLLRQETTSAPTTIDRRQQISPEINFTCDGMITKWIIVANSLTYTNSFFFPELQVWRNIGNDVVELIFFFPLFPRVLILFLSTVHLIQSQSELVMFLESSYQMMPTLEFFSGQRLAGIVLVNITTPLIVISLSHLSMSLI